MTDVILQKQYEVSDSLRIVSYSLGDFVILNKDQGIEIAISDALEARKLAYKILEITAPLTEVVDKKAAELYGQVNKMTRIKAYREFVQPKPQLKESLEWVEENY